MQKFALLLPTYHLSQLVLGAFGYASAGSTSSHWVGLLGFTLIMLGVTWIAFRRFEENS
jgi:ABC-2 type transport system permease protein